MEGSQKILVTSLDSRAGTPKDHFPKGRMVTVNIACETIQESLDLVELLRSDRLWLTNSNPQEFLILNYDPLKNDPAKFCQFD